MPNIGIFFIFLASLLWSVDGLLRTTLYSLPPATVVFYEHFFGLIVLLFFWKKWLPDVGKLEKRDWILITLVAFFSGALGTMLYTSALAKVNYIQFSVVVLLQQLQPIWAISSAAILLKESLPKKFILWAGVALIASYFVTFKDLTVNLDPSNQTAVAGAFALLAGMMWGSSTALSKSMLNKFSFVTTTALRFFLASVIALSIVFAFSQEATVVQLSTDQLRSLLMITFSTGLVALLLYYFGLKKVPAKVSTIVELTWPASAIFIDYFYFHKTLSFTQLLGVMVLFYSMYQVTKMKKI